MPQPGRVELTAARLASSADEVRVAFREAMANHCEGLMIKGLTQPYVPGDRKAWLKLKKDYLSEAEAGSAGLAMADSVDLVVLGAYYGTGAKGGMMSVFLMGVFDEVAGVWKTVCKCGNGHDDAKMAELQVRFHTA